MNAQADDWRTHQTNLTTHQNKVRQLEGEIRDLLAQKRHTENPDLVKQIADSIASKYELLKEATEEYREEMLHVRFKHPEKGDETERKYRRVSLKTLRELEDETGLEGRLNRIKKQVTSVYGSFAVEEQRPPSPKKPSIREPATDEKAKVTDGEGAERIKLSR